MTDELLRCLRWGREGDQRLRALEEGEWRDLFERLDSGHAPMLLARRLQRAGVQAPPMVAAGLRRRMLETAGANLAMRSALVEAVSEVDRPALLLKGVDIAERLYGNPAWRAMGDVDLLVRRDDVAVYDRWFAARGHASEPAFDPRLLDSDAYHHLAYDLGEKRRIELHWRLSNKSRLPDLAAVWQRAEPAPGFAPAAWVMERNDLFLHLCLHLKHHSFGTSLAQLWDLAEQLAHPDLAPDWAVLRERAPEWGVRHAIALALRLLDDLLGVKVEAAADWEAPPLPAIALPDLLGRLGRFSGGDPLDQQRWAMLVSRRSSLRERLWGLRLGLLPARAEIRARYGRPGDGAWRDGLSYLRHWRRLALVRLPSLRGRERASRQARAERTAALRRYLYGDER